MSKDIKDLMVLTKRHMKLYFKDKQSFLTSMITPIILIVLFVTFLKNVYVESLTGMLPKGVELSEKLVNSFSASWLISSILGVTCVTLAFCANTIMITDKVNGSVQDILIAPVKKVVLSLSYFLANYLSTLLVCSVCLIIGLLYIRSNGWYLKETDILILIGNMLLCIAFGSLLASIVEFFISSQGGASALATLVSSMYGFVCGAYMPISQFSKSIQNFVAFIPGTHGTVLFRYYFMNGIMNEMEKELPASLVDGMRKGFDNQLYFFDSQLSNTQMFTTLGLSCIVLLIIYMLIVILSAKIKKGGS